MTPVHLRLALVSVCWFASAAACRRESVEAATTPSAAITPTVSTGIAVSESFRSLVYSQSFAQRFHLPAKGVTSLEAGLHALALRISDPSVDRGRCSIDLFLDDTVNFAYPEGTEGSINDIRSTAVSDGALRFFAEAVADQDTQVALASRWQVPKTVFRSKNADGSLKQFQIWPVESFYRGVASELNLVSFDVICSILLADSEEVELWLLRAGKNSEELSPTGVNDALAQRFVVPARLLKHSHGAIARAVKMQTDVTRIPPPGAQRKQGYSLPD